MDRTGVTSIFVGRIGVRASIFREKIQDVRLAWPKLTTRFDMRIIFRDETTSKWFCLKIPFPYFHFVSHMVFSDRFFPEMLPKNGGRPPIFGGSTIGDLISTQVPFGQYLLQAGPLEAIRGRAELKIDILRKHAQYFCSYPVVNVYITPC